MFYNSPLVEQSLQYVANIVWQIHDKLSKA